LPGGGTDVHDRKLALGLLAREVCVAQSYDWGVEAQVDWYEAYADLGGERTKLYVFALRSMASGAAFHGAFSNATQQAFLEAHELAFAWFGGVFHRLGSCYICMGKAQRRRGATDRKVSSTINQLVLAGLLYASGERIFSPRSPRLILPTDEHYVLTCGHACRCRLRWEVWNGQSELRGGEGVLLAEDDSGSGAERDVDSHVLPTAPPEGESVLLLAAPTEDGPGGRSAAQSSRAWG